MAASHPGRASRGFGLALGVLGLLAGCHSGAAGGHGHDAAVEVAPEVHLDAPAMEVICAPDAAGGGQCPLNFCGQPKTVAALPAGQMSELGADAVCTPGYLCVPDGPTPDGNALQLRCVAPRAGAVAFGTDCSVDASAATSCGSDALCVAAPDASKFCSRLCRADADCPTDSYCLEQRSAPLPKGSYVNLAFCTPKAKIGAKVCAREADCAADEGCVSYGARSGLLVCKKTGGTKSLGDACTAGSQCRSGECYDRAFRLPAMGARAYCSGNCKVNSDCSPDQRCTRIVLANNATPADPRDDVVAGYCETLYVPAANAGCKQDADCTADGADICEKKYGLCYKKGAATGTPCTADVGCDLGAVCMTGQRFKGGYCQTFGCATGAKTGVDACPGATATCGQRASDAPIRACYEGCAKTTDCSRNAEGYACVRADDQPQTPATLCLFDQGV
jgi:hypothetical protein